MTSEEVKNECWCCGNQKELDVPYQLCWQCEKREWNSRLKNIDIEGGSPHYLLLLNPDNPLYKKAEKIIEKQ